MTFLGPQSDRAVRSAVDAYLDGRLRPEVDGEAVFETRNSRYRLIDGTLFSASDATLVGSELVGWLTETADESLVSAWWRPGARAVLVDRKHGQHIVVTSATRLLKVDTAGSPRGSPSPLGGSHPLQGGFAPAPYPSPQEAAPPQALPQAPTAIPPLPAIPAFGYAPTAPPGYGIGVRPSSPADPLPNAVPQVVPPAPPPPRAEAWGHAPMHEQPIRERPAEPIHPPPRRVAPPMHPLPAAALPPQPLPRYASEHVGDPAIVGYAHFGPSDAAETSAAEISNFEIIGEAGDAGELPRFAGLDESGPADFASDISDPGSEEDSFPTMQRRVARPHRVPPPPGPLAQPRRNVPPAPPSERLPLSRGLPLR